MKGARELTLIELDSRSSAAYKPVGIITADCSGAREFDDGIAITELPAAQETYRVSVFSVDTSPLYYEDSIVNQVLERTRTKYEQLEDGTRGRDPMLEPSITKDLHFSARSGARSALVTSFIVTADEDPSEVDVSFGHVEVLKNYAFGSFANMCRQRAKFRKYGRAAAFLLRYLENDQQTAEQIFTSLTKADGTDGTERGRNITRAFTVGAGHLVAKTMADEGRPIVYRNHYRGSAFDVNPKFEPLAFFSTTPAPHSRMGLSVHCRITSPLRQAEDFMTLGQVHGRALGRNPSTRDKLLLQETVGRLNAPIVDRAHVLQSA